MVRCLLILLVLLFLGGCRRPQVIDCVCKKDYIIDYNFDCVLEYEDDAENKPEIETRDLEPDDFVPAPINPGTYKLEVGDVFQISVYGEQDTTVEKVAVANDGNLYYLILKPIPAEGHTIKEVSEELESRLKDLYVAPRVSITPVFVSGLNWKILGRVNRPGMYPLTIPTTLRGAIAKAGGLVIETLTYESEDERTRLSADLSRSFIIRDGKKLNIDFEKVLFTPTSDQNVYLRPNDYIYIHPLDRQEVYVLGNVRRNQAVPFYKNMTLMAALSAANGWDYGNPYGANMHKVLILRGKLCDPTYMLVDVTEILNGCAMDVLLCPGDIVFVPNKPFRFVRELIRLAAESYVFGYASNAGIFYSEVRWFPINNSSDSTDTTSGN